MRLIYFSPPVFTDGKKKNKDRKIILPKLLQNSPCSQVINTREEK